MTEFSTTTTCYVHPNRETSLRCKRCERYICTSCAVSTPTGYICKECMRERQKSFDTALWYDFALGFVVAGLLSGVASFLVTLIGAIGFIGFIEPQTDWWCRLEGVVQKQHFLAAKASREKRIPKLPDGFADGWNGKEAFEQGHGAA